MPRSETVTIVSGLPRSGTSLIMSMLAAGGIPPLTDGIRAADEDNPKGYFELERAKKLKAGDTAWLDEARGKAVKVISQLVLSLPASHRYKVVFMRRNMAEVLASQRRMLIRRGTDKPGISDEEMGPLLARHVDQVMAWMKTQDNIECRQVDYNDVVRDAGPIIEELNQFLGGGLDTEAMCAVIDHSLYRQRKAVQSG